MVEFMKEAPIESLPGLSSADLMGLWQLGVATLPDAIEQRTLVMFRMRGGVQPVAVRQCCGRRSLFDGEQRQFEATSVLVDLAASLQQLCRELFLLLEQNVFLVRFLRVVFQWPSRSSILKDGGMQYSSMECADIYSCASALVRDESVNDHADITGIEIMASLTPIVVRYAQQTITKWWGPPATEAKSEDARQTKKTKLQGLDDFFLSRSQPKSKQITQRHTFRPKRRWPLQASGGLAQKRLDG
jgi:hypothetical protein